MSDPKGDFTDYLNTLDQKELLRFITCGSVDDGKSTLIGRILFETGQIYDDQLHALLSDSKKFGTTEDEPDLALLLDGLAAEREQGITIDVAYRYFATGKRKFIVADTPGHEQYTRNMATGASTADAAIVIVDARKGIVTQTRRHSFIAAMLGVKQIILAVNKMDLVAYDEQIYQSIKAEFQQIMQSLRIEQWCAIPVSALKGVNITALSEFMPWYTEQALLPYLEQIDNNAQRQAQPFRMAIQLVNRPHSDFRGFAGRIAAGTLAAGDLIQVLPGGQTAHVTRLVCHDGDLKTAVAGQSITVILDTEIDISRGNVLAAADKPVLVSDQFNCRLLWLNETAMVSGRQYLLKCHTATALCTPGKPRYRIDVNTFEQLAANELNLNEIGDCDLFLDRPIAFEPYSANRELGGFILIDRLSSETVAAGFIQSSRNSNTDSGQSWLINQAQRSAIKGQKPVVLWFTGLSGAGKSTIANLLERELNALGKHTMLLDGDCIRHGLNRDLDFTVSDRAENIRRITEVAKLMAEAGLITLVSFISPFQAEREMARARIGNEQFLEIFVDAPLAVVEARDVKGLYKKARAGELSHFTGISSPYEIPAQPDLVLETAVNSPEQCVEKIVELLKRERVLK
ncbi:sulfate adenylyltransferase subunit CysN [Legionella dresdenensis]|uniref:Adenylyl-sulfate kinase n=1 Tax=Legionella dresdenensis TaxID=450200 RepID=A0ABV8CGZ9_9GAMM